MSHSFALTLLLHSSHPEVSSEWPVLQGPSLCGSQLKAKLQLFTNLVSLPLNKTLMSLRETVIWLFFSPDRTCIYMIELSSGTHGTLLFIHTIDI